MPADDSQPIRVTEGVNYVPTRPPHPPPTAPLADARAHILTHPKQYHASSKFTMNQKHITSRGDSFIKCLWISDRDVCRTLSPGTFENVECLAWPHIDLTPFSCE